MTKIELDTLISLGVKTSGDIKSVILEQVQKAWKSRSRTVADIYRIATAKRVDNKIKVKLCLIK